MQPTIHKGQLESVQGTQLPWAERLGPSTRLIFILIRLLFRFTESKTARVVCFEPAVGAPSSQ